MARHFALLEAAVSCGSPTRGTEFAYDALVGAGLPALLGGAACYPMEKLPPCTQYPPHLLHLDTVMAVSRALRANLLTALEGGQFPVVIGGDHSIAMGSLAALGEFYGAENLAVVFSPTPIVAPMPQGMALMTVIDPWELPWLVIPTPSS